MLYLTKKQIKEVIDNYVIGRKDIAELMDTSKQNVEYHLKKEEFPEPVSRPGGHPLWLREEVEEYAGNARRRKTK